MKRFIKVMALSCKEDGKINDRVPKIKKELIINVNLIYAILDKRLYFKEDLLKIGGAYFTEVDLAEDINLQDI